MEQSDSERCAVLQNFKSKCPFVVIHASMMFSFQTELDLVARGLMWTPAAAGLFVPFWDGSSILLHDDDQLCELELLKHFPNDVQGWKNLNQLFDGYDSDVFLVSD